MDAVRQRFTLRHTRRTVPIIFSMMLVQASARRSWLGKPSRVTVSISSSPSRMLADAPGASCSSRRARLRISFSAFSASSNSQAWRSTRRTAACNDGGRRPNDVACFVNLTALDRSVAPERSSDRLRKRLRTIDDEQPRYRRIKPALDQVVDERLNHCCVLGRTLDKSQRVLYPVAIDPDCCHKHEIVDDVDAVDLYNQDVQAREVRCHPFLHALGRQRYEMTGGRRLRHASPVRGRNVALGQPHRPPKL